MKWMYGIKIIICDKDEEFRNKVQILIEQYCHKYSLRCRIEKYSSGKKCLENLDECRILFLDIDIDDMDGIEVKDKVPAINKRAAIVYLSSCVNRIEEAFGPQVCAFLDKPVDRGLLYNVLDKLLYEEKNQYRITVEIDGELNKILTDEVLYIIAQKPYSRIVTIEKDYMIRKTLREWEIELEKYDFYKIHRSILINLKYSKVINSKVIMSDGIMFTIAERRVSDAREIYNNYIKKMANKGIC